jgi:hypothetical protein
MNLSSLRPYVPFLFLVAILTILFFNLIPAELRPASNAGRVRAIFGALLFGGLVGVAEIASRYRDEPLKAVLSPYGLIYETLNGYISVLALFLIYHFSDKFPAVANDNLLAAITAGFGATVVMRTRIAVIKGADGKDVSVGPDYVIGIVLQMIDTNIDRWRAVRRQNILSDNFQKIRQLGEFSSAWRYLLASLLAFQNLDDARKKTLSDTYNDYLAQDLPDDIKRLGLGFLFLTLVGESNFGKVLECANRLQAGVAAGQNPPPPPPVVPAHGSTP